MRIVILVYHMPDNKTESQTLREQKDKRIGIKRQDRRKERKKCIKQKENPKKGAPHVHHEIISDFKTEKDLLESPRSPAEELP
jgi:hypothetical protein